MLAAIDVLLESDDRVAIFRSYRLLAGVVGHTGDRTSIAWERLSKLDPMWDPECAWSCDPDVKEVVAANRHIDARRALKRLKALGRSLPKTGRARQGLEVYRALRLHELGEDQRAVEALEAAWRADPSSVETAWRFGFASWETHHRTDEAFEAVEAALDVVEHQTHVYRPTPPGAPGYWPWAESYPRWAEEHHRGTEQLVTLRNSLAPPGTPRLPAPAAPVLGTRHHLVRGLAQEDRNGDRHLVRAALGEGRFAEEAAEALRDRDVWFVAGLEAHLDAWRDGAPRGDWLERITHHVLESPDWTGQPFPSASFEVDGVVRTLEDFDGIRVVDVWVSWCPPCIPGLKELDRIARERKGVTVLAVSVDQERERVERAVEGVDLELVVGWAPSTFGDVTHSYPSVFVVDADGIVVASLSGSATEALEEVLDRLASTSAAR